MYKRTSLMTGANIPLPNRQYPKRSKQHGEIVIRMMGGVEVDPPLRLPGDWSSRAECDYCHDYFSLNPTTPIVILFPEYPFDDTEPLRKYRWFCCEPHCDGWIAGIEHRLEYLKNKERTS